MKKIKKLNEYGKYIEAANWFKKNKLSSEFTKKEHFWYRILQCDIKNGLRQPDKALSLIDEIILELANENLKFELVQAFITKSVTLEQMRKYQLSFDAISKGFSVLRRTPNKKSNEYQELKIRLLSRNASLNFQIGNNNKMISYAKRALKISENLNNTNYIAFCFSLLSLGYGRIHKYNKSLEFMHESLLLFQEMKNDYQCVIVYHYLARMYYHKGEPNLALEYMKKTLPIIQRFGDDYRIGVTLLHLIPILIENGDYKLARKYANLCFESLNKMKLCEAIGMPIYYLIRIAIYQEDISEAKKNLEILSSFRKKCANPTFYHQQYDFSNALILKNSNIPSDKAKAEEIFRNLLDADDVPRKIIFEAIYYLCELLLHGFQETKNPNILKEVDSLSLKIMEIGNKNEFIGLRINAYSIRLLLLYVREQNEIGTVDPMEIDSLIFNIQELTERLGLKTTIQQILNQHSELINPNKI
ncbi:MAG: tetratricopeptide repeat protein [Candidatus Heimdallarchaeota archaeon]